LKGRYVDVHLPRPEIKIPGQEVAKQHRMSLSKFVMSAVENRLTEAASPRSPGETIRLQEENRKLRDEVKLRALALKQAETGLFRLMPSNGVFITDLSASGITALATELLFSTI
jgi:hypothetical protein